MIYPTKISSKVVKGVPFLVVFCLFLSFASFAQNERDRVVPDLPRNSDTVNQYEGSESSTSEQKSENVQKQSIAPLIESKSGVTNTQTKKDNAIYKMGGEKEIKKEGMSTLSFNLFLYIVDKFKED
ncbi:hypothetical protein [Aquiflexum lacus]|uniref:hypothetical protein n=1 Tax=Aquiflexum lacus TaxID=2483805 RepID=UPI001893C5A6|nr:hypothetical protein [Aquiflexum lacus]